MGTFFSGSAAADEAFVATALTRMGKLINIISRSNAVLGQFVRKGMKTSISGGHTITVPLLVNETNDPTWFSGFDQVNKDFTPGLTSAEYTWSWVSQAITMALTDELENAGKSRVMSLMETRFRQARHTLLNNMADKFVNGTGGKEPNGLLTAIEAAAPASQTEVVGGIDKSQYSWWRNQYKEHSSAKFGTNVAGASSNMFLAAGLVSIMELFMQCAQGPSTPFAFYTNKAIAQNALRAMMENYGLRGTGHVDDVADTIPHQVAIFGKPIVGTDEIPANTGLWLTANNDSGVPGLTGLDKVDELSDASPADLGGIYVASHSEADMRLLGPYTPNGQHVQTYYLLNSMMIVFENMQQQGRLGVASGKSLDTY